ncbi:hypothetical protein [Gordonia alkanivorans]|uniref:hypothetical protein n=1 Tax=Gordonia alkanivorans TaxID=84096 RepID=UPI0004B1F699|nr:hypothetical protein [Gordonia alkanivorans]
MRDRLLDLLDRIPRWGELSKNQRILGFGALGAVALVVLIATLWVGVLGGGSDDEANLEMATGPRIEEGFAPCSRTASSQTVPEIVAATVGDMSGLPYQANLVEATRKPGADGQVVVTVVCMRPDSNLEQLKDVATILAQNIKSHHDVASRISLFGVVNVGDGDDHLGEVFTEFREHAFDRSDGVYNQRKAWMEMPVN